MMNEKENQNPGDAEERIIIDDEPYIEERGGDKCLRCGNPIDHTDPHLYCSNCHK